MSTFMQLIFLLKRILPVELNGVTINVSPLVVSSSADGALLKILEVHGLEETAAGDPASHIALKSGWGIGSNTDISVDDCCGG